MDARAVLRDDDYTIGNHRSHVRYVLWDITGWHANYDPCLWRNRATEDQKRVGWEMWVRMEKILCRVLHEAHERQIEETMDTLSEGPESFYR